MNKFLIGTEIRAQQCNKNVREIAQTIKKQQQKKNQKEKENVFLPNKNLARKLEKL